MTAPQFLIGPLFVKLTQGTQKKNYHAPEWHSFKQDFNMATVVKRTPAMLFTEETGYKRKDDKLSTRLTFSDGSTALVEETIAEIDALTLKAAKKLARALTR